MPTHRVRARHIVEHHVALEHTLVPLRLGDRHVQEAAEAHGRRRHHHQHGQPVVQRHGENLLRLVRQLLAEARRLREALLVERGAPALHHVGVHLLPAAQQHQRAYRHRRHRHRQHRLGCGQRMGGCGCGLAFWPLRGRCAPVCTPAAVEGSSTTVSRSDIRLGIPNSTFGLLALGLVRRWLLIGCFPMIHLLPGGFPFSRLSESRMERPGWLLRVLSPPIGSPRVWQHVAPETSFLRPPLVAGTDSYASLESHGAAGNMLS
jgi:hypothetical protein